MSHCLLSCIVSDEKSIILIFIPSFPLPTAVLWNEHLLNFSDDLLILNLYKHSVKFISLSLAYIVTLKFQLQRFLGAQRLFNYLLENNFQMQQGHHPFSHIY